MARAPGTYCPHLELLEHREQPGSILPGALDSPLAGIGLSGPDAPALPSRPGWPSSESPSSRESTGILAPAVTPFLSTVPDATASGLAVLPAEAGTTSGLFVRAVSNFVPRGALESDSSGRAVEVVPSAEPLGLGHLPRGGAGPDDGNMVTNGSFETGDLSGWTLRGNQAPLAVGDSPVAPHSGAFALEVGLGVKAAPFTSFLTPSFMYEDAMSQPAQEYDLTFSLQMGVGVSQFTLNWGGQTVYEEGNIPHAYFDYGFLLRATSTVTRLEFGFQMQSASAALDDVVLVPC